MLKALHWRRLWRAAFSTGTSGCRERSLKVKRRRRSSWRRGRSGWPSWRLEIRRTESGGKESRSRVEPSGRARKVQKKARHFQRRVWWTICTEGRGGVRERRPHGGEHKDDCMRSLPCCGIVGICNFYVPDFLRTKAALICGLMHHYECPCLPVNMLLAPPFSVRPFHLSTSSWCQTRSCRY